MRTSATRAGLAARRISELLRGSAISVVLNDGVGLTLAGGGRCAAAASTSRVTSGARSVAIACLQRDDFHVGARSAHPAPR